MKHINVIYSDRCESVGKAIWKLCMMNIAIHSIDMNRARPVITVQASAGTEKLNGAFFMRRGTPEGIVRRMQAGLENCRIEWEVQL